MNVSSPSSVVSPAVSPLQSSPNQNMRISAKPDTTAISNISATPAAAPKTTTSAPVGQSPSENDTALRGATPQPSEALNNAFSVLSGLSDGDISGQDVEAFKQVMAGFESMPDGDRQALLSNLGENIRAMMGSGGDPAAVLDILAASTLGSDIGSENGKQIDGILSQGVQALNAAKPTELPPESVAVAEKPPVNEPAGDAPPVSDELKALLNDPSRPTSLAYWEKEMANLGNLRRAVQESDPVAGANFDAALNHMSRLMDPHRNNEKFNGPQPLDMKAIEELRKTVLTLAEIGNNVFSKEAETQGNRADRLYAGELAAKFTKNIALETINGIADFAVEHGPKSLAAQALALKYFTHSAVGFAESFTTSMLDPSKSVEDGLKEAAVNGIKSGLAEGIADLIGQIGGDNVGLKGAVAKKAAEALSKSLVNAASNYLLKLSKGELGTDEEKAAFWKEEAMNLGKEITDVILSAGLDRNSIPADLQNAIKSLALTGVDELINYLKE